MRFTMRSRLSRSFEVLAKVDMFSSTRLQQTEASPSAGRRPTTPHVAADAFVPPPPSGCPYPTPALVPLPLSIRFSYPFPLTIRFTNALYLHTISLSQSPAQASG